MLNKFKTGELMNFPFIIEKKRYAEVLDPDEIRAFIRGAVDGSVPDYQVAAMLMAICLNGMNAEEAKELVAAMLESSGHYDISDEVPLAVEQHTTGGVGEGVDLTLLPLLATVGLNPTKITAPAIGISSGIIDKVDAIPGMNTNVDRDAFLAIIRKVGLALANHGPDLVPADARLYAVRDVTATIDSVALIAGSILSKKIATGARSIHISVKFGRTGLVKSRDRAIELASLMAEVATGMGRRVTVPVIQFDGPLGRAIGNALEIRQAIELTKGGGPADLRDHIVRMGAQILHLTGRETNPVEGRKLLSDTLDSGKVFETFCNWVAAQGGDRRHVEDPDLLPTAPVQRYEPAPADGVIIDMDGRLAGELAIGLGAGRLKANAPLDHRVGLVLHKRNGERVTRGEPLFTVHAADEAAAEQVIARLAPTYDITEGTPRPMLVEDQVFGIGSAAFSP